MAKIKFTVLVDEARGKFGNAVFSKNKSGQYFREGFIPANPNTFYQAEVRAFFSTTSKAWRALTQAQRDSFAAAAPDFIKKNVFGVNVQLSGFQLFMKLNQSLFSIGGTPLTSAPSSAQPFQPILTVAHTGTTINWSVDGEGLAGVQTGVGVVLEVTRPQSAGRSAVESMSYRILGATTNVEIGGNNATTYNAFGTPVAGEKVFFRAYTINQVTGVRSGYTYAVLTW